MLAMLSLVGFEAASCSIPIRPSWWPHSSTPVAASTSLAASNTVARLGHARPSRYQLGLDIYWSQGSLPAAAVRADAARIINFALSLHANSISISFPFYTPGPRASTVYVSKRNSPSPVQIGVFLRLAREAGVRTIIRPLLSELTLRPQHVSRAKIRPGNIAEWFGSYSKLIAPYLRAANVDHASSFVVGTELVSLSHQRELWRSLIAAAHRIYRGPLLFEDRYKNFKLWTGYRSQAAFEADIWPGFKLRDNATISQLTRTWKKFLATYARQRSLRSLVISETGIAAVPGSYRHSGSWFGIGTPTKVGRLMQARWYTALCAAARAGHIRGLYWWEINFAANPAAPGQWDRTDQFTFMDVPAQQAVSSCFRSWSGGK